MPKHKSNIIPFRRIAAIAACLVLVFSFATSANAFSFRDVWNAVVTWAQETFSFSMGVEISAPKTGDENNYFSFPDILEKNGRNHKIVPSVIADGFELMDVIIDRTPIQESYLAIYQNQETTMKISVKSFLDSEPEQIEQSQELLEVYSVSGIDFYFFANYDQLQVVWIIDSYECYISGELTVDQMKIMIDSIEKG